MEITCFHGNRIGNMGLFALLFGSFISYSFNGHARVCPCNAYASSSAKLKSRVVSKKEISKMFFPKKVFGILSLQVGVVSLATFFIVSKRYSTNRPYIRVLDSGLIGFIFRLWRHAFY